VTSSHVLHLDRDGSRLATIVFPRAWLQASPWMHTEALAQLDLDAGAAYMAGGVLHDGTNLIGLVYPGGQRVLRALLEGGIDEHFSGRPLTEDDELLIETWRHAVASWVRAGRFVRELRGAR